MSLKVEDVYKSFPIRAAADRRADGAGAETLDVLRGIGFELATGENLAIVGPSGSGKSTLLGILGTLETPTSGRVLLDDVDPAELSESELARLRNERIGFVFQEHYLLPQCNVRENVLLPTLATGGAESDAPDRADELLRRVGLEGRADHRPAELSGGERQRAALARALINRPRLVLADEPTGNLDRTTADHVADLLADLQQQEQFMMIVATHSESLARRMQQAMELDGT